MEVSIDLTPDEKHVRRATRFVIDDNNKRCLVDRARARARE